MFQSSHASFEKAESAMRIIISHYDLLSINDDSDVDVLSHSSTEIGDAPISEEKDFTSPQVVSATFQGKATSIDSLFLPEDYFLEVWSELEVFCFTCKAITQQGTSRRTNKSHK